MTKFRFTLRTTTLLLLLVVPLSAQDSTNNPDMKNCPIHKEHAEAASQHSITLRDADKAMGFQQEKTTHHFQMSAYGGEIRVTANDPSDKINSEAIRLHLSRIAMMFSNGDFTAPMLVHDTVPPGVTTMKLLKDKIRYEYEAIPGGGCVRIQSSDPVALAAIHDFLRFQSAEHPTGDRPTIE